MKSTGTARPVAGFIGLGDIGEPMCGSLLRAGHPVVSSAHRRRKAIERLAGNGLREVDDPRAVARECDVLITCVVDAAQTDAVLRPPGGALEALQPGSALVVTSTLAPEYCRGLAAECEARAIGFLDCPVSGGRERAARGDLALITGGDEAVVERCRPLLEAMGRVFHCGPAGMGQVAKLVNQGLLFAVMELVREGRALGRSYGLDLDILMAVLSASTGQTAAGDHWKTFEAMWPHAQKLWRKDTALCLDAARARNVALPLIEARQALPWSEVLEPAAGRSGR